MRSIRRDMLNEPADAPVLPVATQSRDHFRDYDGQRPANSWQPNPPPNATESRTTQSEQDHWPRQQPEDGQIKSVENQTESGGPASIFSLLLAWVLLTGSVGGNVYLFWSYLDVRGKYQSMVRTARSPLATAD